MPFRTAFLATFATVSVVASGCGADPQTAPPPGGTRAAEGAPSHALTENAAPSTSEQGESVLMDENARRQANQPLLEEVAAAGGWFRAKKTRPIWVRKLDAPQRIMTLEGEEEVPAGTYLCRGEAGDLWPQSPERLESKYDATDELSVDGWRKYVPRPDNEGVLAARVDRSFHVEAAWGRLAGKPGDYVVKNYSDRDVVSPADVWIVDRGLFQATYQAVSSGAQTGNEGTRPTD